MDYHLRNLPRLVPKADRQKASMRVAKKHWRGHKQDICFLSRNRAAEAEKPSWEKRVLDFKTSKKMDPQTLARFLHWFKRGKKGGGKKTKNTVLTNRTCFLSKNGEKSVQLSPQRFAKDAGKHMHVY